jgi:low affinity Fe/Cu permease
MEHRRANYILTHVTAQGERPRMNFFDRAANHLARLMGHPGAFALACLAIVVWGALGPFAGYSDTWQLVINTSTTIVTFLMVFLIQNTQNRDSHAMHLKIDELLRALDAADTRLVDLEERSEKDLERLHQHYVALAGGVPPDQPAAQTGEPPSTPDRPDRNRSRDRNVQKSQS